MSVGGLQGGLEPSADAATGRGGAAGAAGAAQDTFMIDDASISMMRQENWRDPVLARCDSTPSFREDHSGVVKGWESDFLDRT